MKILVIYFSFTSNVCRLATSIKSQLESAGEVTVRTIEPQKSRGYWGWLARSFLPGWRVAIKETITDLAPYDLICLGFPKWTLSCPPVNQYLRVMTSSRGKKLALFMSYGGFDEKRYLRSMGRRVARTGTIIVATLAMRRRVIRQEDYHQALRQFCRQALVSCGYEPPTEG